MVLSSYYTGFSGIDAQMRNFEAIGNNIANVNTPGFKRSSVSFTNLLDKEGVRVAGTNLDMSQGRQDETGGTLDVAIKGDGFLVLENGVLTRNGAMDIDSTGKLNIGGAGVLDVNGDVIDIDMGSKMAASASTTITLDGTLAAGKAIQDIEVEGGTLVFKHIMGTDNYDYVLTAGNGNVITASVTGAPVSVAGGTITINGSTFALDDYETLQDLADAVNASGVAKMSVDGGITISAVGAADSLTLSETEGVKKIGARIQIGGDTSPVAVDEFDGYGEVRNGTIKGTVTGEISDAHVRGVAEGVINADMEDCVMEGEIMGRLTTGSFEGAGIMDARVKLFEGKMSGIAAQRTDSNDPSQDSDDTNPAFITGKLVGSAVGTISGSMKGTVFNTETDYDRLDVATDPIFIRDFRLEGHVVGEVFAKVEGEGKVVGEVGSTTEHANVHGTIIGQVGNLDQQNLVNAGDPTYRDGDPAAIDLDIIRGEIEGSAVGVIKGHVTGHVWTWDNAAEEYDYQGWVDDYVDMDGIVSGTISGEVLGVARGKIVGDVEGYIGENQNTDQANAIVEGEITGIVNATDDDEYADITGVVYDDVGDNHTLNNCEIDATGYLTGNFDGEVEGEIRGKATGEIEGTIRSADIIARSFEGKGETDSGGAVHLVMTGTAVGDLENFGTTPTGITAANAELVNLLQAFNLDLNGDGTTDNVAQVIGKVTTQGDGVIDMDDSDGVIRGTVTGTVQNGVGDADMRAVGDITGSISTNDADLDGTYSGYLENVSVEAEGKLVGNLATDVQTAGNDTMKFKGRVEGTIMNQAHMVGHLTGYIGDNWIDDFCDITLASGDTFRGVFEGYVERNATDGTVVITGVMEGYIVGEVDGTLTATKETIQGLLTAAGIEAGTIEATGGTVTAVDGQVVVDKYGVTADVADVAQDVTVTVVDDLGREVEVTVTVEDLGGGEIGVLSDTDLEIVNNLELGASTDISASADGNTEGTLDAIRIEDDGTIVGTYSNNEEVALAQIGVATVQNADALEQVEGGFRTTAASGDAVIGVGDMRAGFLELSNVDLTEEFTDMIIAERAFQSNIRIVTASDRIIMELMRIRA
jgi:flagellar hook-basal body protein